jgi:tRNA A37 threonylcarbamoyladenosine biosynthesis protein TsaE
MYVHVELHPLHQIRWRYSQIESNIRLELISQHVDEQVTVMREAQARASRDADMGEIPSEESSGMIVDFHSARLDKLSYIPAAQYDSDELHDEAMTCLEGTRVTLLNDLDAWATSTTSAPFFWLNGLAGTGKSTVARTFYEQMLKRKDPVVRLATFFISRYSTDRRKAINILHTMVYQLALQDDTIRSSITEALAQEPDLLTRSLGQQVTKVLSDVIGHVQSSHPIVLVLDALDECETDS